MRKLIKENLTYNDFKQLIFSITEKSDDPYLNYVNKVYSLVMLCAILLSLTPLAFREQTALLYTIEYFCVLLFVVDYVCRWITADLRLKNVKHPFLRYPFTFEALVDLFSILPSFTPISYTYNLLRSIRLIRIIRIFKLLRYSTEMMRFLEVMYRQRSVLLSIFSLAIIYIFITALLLFNLDPNFETFFDALYASTITLTTVGYGDLIPHTDLGRLVTMISSLIGVAIIALPSGVITASYLKSLEDQKNKQKRNRYKD